MKYPNIIFISGDNSYLVEREKNRLVKAFGEKYGHENIEKCPLSDVNSYGQYEQNIASVSLLSPKRMFVFYGGKEKKSKKNDGTDMKNHLEKILPELSRDDFLLFYEIPKTEMGILDFLDKYATERPQKFSWNVEKWTPYTSLPPEKIAKVLDFYQKEEAHRDRGDSNPFLGHAIFSTLEHLSALHEKNIPIDKKIISDFSVSYEGGKIFDFLDAILSDNAEKSFFHFERIRETLDNKNIDIFFASLISNIRNNLYLISLRDAGLSQAEIARKFPKIHPFVLSKSYTAKISSKKLATIFRYLVETNIAYKSGK